MPIKILIADDHQIIREGLKSLIESEPDLVVCGMAKDGFEAIALANEFQPEVVIMDIGMPGLNGIDAAEKITSCQPQSRVIALSMLRERRFISQMFRVGAKGYLLKDCAFEELLGAVATVMKGQVYLSPGVAGIVLEDYFDGKSAEPDSASNLLSTREREVLQLLAEGCSTKETAFKLNISIKTIETHRRQIMKKLDLHSVAELTKYALKEGITSL